MIILVIITIGSLKIISKEGKKKILFALDSKVGPVDFLSMKVVEFKQH